MNCKICQTLISAFLDNELDETSSANIQTHLSVCADCAKVCEDFAMILDYCHDESGAKEIVPPNSQALWCRINNVIEADLKQEIQTQNAAPPEMPKTFISRVWQLSFAQVSSAVLGIALISSLLTFVGIKNYTAQAADDNFAAQSTVAPNFFDRVLAKVGLIETPQQARERRVAQQKSAIDYWNKRVEVRREQWDNHLRIAFDRNLNEINQAVDEYTLILQENPQDDLSGEMLDSALDEKMELLREFSDL